MFCLGSMLLDVDNVSDDALDLKQAIKMEDINQDGDDSDDDDDFGEWRGFCVFAKKIVIYGNDGLFVADVPQ